MDESAVSKSLPNDESRKWGDVLAAESRPQGRGKLYLLLTIIALVAVAIAFGIIAQLRQLDAPADVVLDATIQNQIWDSEHATFKIEAHFCKPFVEVLRSRNGTSLAEFFQPDCSGRVFAKANEEAQPRWRGF